MSLECSAKYVRSATVAIVEREENVYKGGMFGSGLIFQAKDTIITARHVVERKITDKFAVYRPFTDRHREARRFATVLERYYHPGRTYWGAPVDLALLKVKWGPGGSVTPAQASTIEQVAVGHRVGLWGWPFGEKLLKRVNVSGGGSHPSLTAGVISAIRPTEEEHRELIQLDITAHNGNSGGPVFSENEGGVIGVFTQGYDFEQIAQLDRGKANAIDIPSGIEFAIPVKTVVELVAMVENGDLKPSILG